MFLDHGQQLGGVPLIRALQWTYRGWTELKAKRRDKWPEMIHWWWMQKCIQAWQGRAWWQENGFARRKNGQVTGLVLLLINIRDPWVWTVLGGWGRSVESHGEPVLDLCRHLESHIRMSVQVLVTLVSMQPPANAFWEAVGDCSRAWAPAICVVEPGRVLGSWLQYGPLWVLSAFGDWISRYKISFCHFLFIKQIFLKRFYYF